jgi:hypothetical protein
MNKNKPAQPKVKFIEKKYRNSIRYYIEVDGEQMKVSKSQFEREQRKYLRTTKSEKEP